MENKTIILPIEPIENITNGLLCIYKDDKHMTLTDKAFADVVKGQREYSMPEDTREIMGIYLKIL